MCTCAQDLCSKDGCGCDHVTMVVCTQVCETRGHVNVYVCRYEYTLSWFLNIILERNPATILHLWLPLLILPEAGQLSRRTEVALQRASQACPHPGVIPTSRFKPHPGPKNP